MRNGSARRVAVSGLLTSLMLVLGLIERQFPLTAAIPGIKLGLANSVLIYALYMLGVKQSIVLMLLKAMMSWLIYTNMQAMFYSLAGGVLSLLAMIALSRIKGVSVIGVSALGAVGFNIGQILVAVAMLHTPQLIAACLDTLSYLARGGRIPKAAADLGKLVNLKPLVALSPEGRVAMAGKAIGRHRAGDALIKMIKASPVDPRYPVLPLYTAGRENCIAFLRQAAQAGYACTIDDAISVGPTIGAHVGPGVFGLAYVSAQA